MQRGLAVELFVTAALALGIAVLVVLLMARRRQRRRAWVVALLLLTGVFGGLAPTTALNVFHYCNQRRVHVDCISDDYDGPLWRVVRPLRREYRAIRDAVIR